MVSDILIVHPYKHHAFQLAAGCLQATSSVTMAFPLYMKGAAQLLKFAPQSVRDRALGYTYDKLPIEKIYSPFVWQCRKLWSFKSHPRTIEKAYDESIANLILSGKIKPRILVTLQDHMTQTVEVAKRFGIKIWSDQIVNMSSTAQERIKKHCVAHNVPYMWWNEHRNDGVLSCADVVTVPSQYVNLGIKDRVCSSTKVCSIPYGVDTLRFNRPRSLDVSSIHVVVRANSLRKGGHLFMASLLKSTENIKKLSSKRAIKFTFLGSIDAELASSFEYLKYNSGLNIFAGDFSHSNVPALLASADLFVMPTLSEGMSLAIPEAMAAGVPIITTPYCGVDYFQPGKMGVLVEDNVISISDGLINALESQKIWDEWSANCRAATKNCGWDRYESDVGALALQLL